MYNLTASWHIADDYSMYNEWESFGSASFKEGLDRMFDMYTHPDNHGCDEQWSDEDGDHIWFTSLNLGKGLFLCKNGSPSFEGFRQDEDWRPMVPIWRRDSVATVDSDGWND